MEGMNRREGDKEHVENVWTHNHTLVVDKSAWCQVCRLQTQAPKSPRP
uniref:Uncharacterized protein n=1 Tax=Arundo donax TaxID=35708 RepID=A0A0A8Y8N9_ARUDO